MTTSQPFLPTASVFKLRSSNPFGIYSEKDFIKQIKEGQKFYMVDSKPGLLFDCTIEEFLLKELQLYYSHKANKDSHTFVVEYCDGERTGFTREGMVEEFTEGLNACFVIDPKKKTYALHAAQHYVSSLQKVWNKIM